jgi:hypothetical protein
MATENDPTPPTGIQAAAPQASSTATQAMPPAEARNIPLPPQPKRAPVTVEQLKAWTQPLDSLLALSVFVLAFLLASFAARNNDLLMQLASGRALLDGKYKLGEDPFSFTTQGVVWVNHSWLYDVAIYLMFKAAGGAALVIVKAILVTVLAGFMLAIRRPVQSLWIPVVCGGIAALALSQRLFLQPVILSYLFLGVTLYLLQRPAPVDVASKGRSRVLRTRRHLWLLPPLFLVWVNLDSWFFLGPVTVVLYWLGELLQGAFAPGREGTDQRSADDNRTLGLVLAAGLIACLVNPHHVRAFTLPPQLTEWRAAGALQGDDYFRQMFWGVGGYYSSGLGWSVAGVAYLVLLGLGLLSFVANYQDWRGWRIVTWTAFAGLSLWHARAIPFFAVVGGPIAALNFQDAVTRFFGSVPRVTPNWRQWAIAGRLLTLTGAIVLIALAWPGWLHATPMHGEPISRNVAWRVDFEPSLERAAKQLQQWHDDGVLSKDDRGLNLSPDLAYAFAWYAPDEKGFLDARFGLFEKATAEYVEALKVLRSDNESPSDVTARLEPLAQILRRRSANHLSLFYTNLGRFADVLTLLENDPTKQWTLVYRDGRTAIFSWDDPQLKGPPRRLTRARISDDRLAFGPQTTPPITERAPAPEALAWYERFLHPRRARPLAADEAFMHLLYFEKTYPHYQQQSLDEWLDAQAAGLVGSGAQALLAGEPLFRAVLADTCFEATYPKLLGARIRKTRPLGMPNLAITVIQRRIDATPGPMALPLLAVRACRRSLLENPNDPEAWYRLQRAYALLSQGTREREWAARLPLLQQFRQVQRMAALNHAFTLEPDSEQVHMDLASMYEQMSSPGQSGYYDLALKHRTQQLRLVDANGPMRHEKPDEYERRRRQLDDHVQRLDALVKKAEYEYELGQVNKTTMRAKAEFALLKGLGGKARDELVQSVEVIAEPEAIPLQLDLMIKTGAIEGESGLRLGLDKAKEQSEESGHKPNMGQLGQNQFVVPRYDWLQLLVAAASGDYRLADQILVPIIEFREQIYRNYVRSRTRAEILDLFAAALFDTQVTPITMLRGIERAARIEGVKMVAAATPQTADLYALRGLLALESGDIDHAAAMFRNVMELKDQGLEPIAKYYLDLLEANK